MVARHARVRCGEEESWADEVVPRPSETRHAQSFWTMGPPARDGTRKRARAAGYQVVHRPVAECLSMRRGDGPRGFKRRMGRGEQESAQALFSFFSFIFFLFLVLFSPLFLSFFLFFEFKLEFKFGYEFLLRVNYTNPICIRIICIFILIFFTY
jgi:hypothetical protein